MSKRVRNRPGRAALQSLAAALLLMGGADAAMAARMVAPDHLNNYWILLNRTVDVDVPDSGRNIDKPGCVAVSYLIGSDGIPQDVKVRAAVPPSDLGSAAVSAVSNFRYGPSLSNHGGNPVSTYYVVPFNAPDDPVQQRRLMAACQLPGYSAN
ncbi:energy transducer TonB [Frateuria aurantia]